MLTLKKKPIFEIKNVLVIGGAGFIGSHLCTELVKSSKVICIDNFSTGNEDNIDHLLNHPHFKFIRHDMSQPLDFEKYPELQMFQVAFQGVQEVYNCACPASSKNFEIFFIETLLANSYVVRNGLEIALKHSAKFIHLSSSAVYGDPLEGQEEFNEQYWGFVNPVGLRSCYNEGKRFAETIVSTYRRKYGLDAKIVRLFNAYGPNMRFDSGRMLPDMIRAASGNDDVVIHGDGAEEKSYCYISDVVDGILKFANSNELELINLGNTEKFSIYTIAQKIVNILGSSSKIIFSDPLPGVTRHALPDISLAKSRLSWFPVVRLDEGLTRTIKEMVASRVLRYSSFTKRQDSGKNNQDS